MARVVSLLARAVPLRHHRPVIVLDRLQRAAAFVARFMPSVSRARIRGGELKASAVTSALRMRT